MPFLGVWGGRPLLENEGFGKLSLGEGRVTLTKDSGEVLYWEFENFSGDWEFVTFDSERKAFLFGAPYNFDHHYIINDASESH